MGPEIQNGEILSTWKEIAAYLKTSVRSCLRWEKKSGLPVHRQEGAPRSRVHAYKNELDAWFKSRMSNGTIHHELDKKSQAFWKKPLIVAPLTVVFAAAVYLVFFRPAARSPGGVPASGTPHSSGPCEVSSGTILETESGAAGRMRIWKNKDERVYFESWRIEPVRHTSCAAGDLDGNPDLEAAAPGHCREFEVAGDYASSKIRFFINAYKQGYSDWWKTTYYDKDQCVIEKDNFEFTETQIGDLDGDGRNEILLVTAHALSVFRYDPKVGELRLVCTRNSFLDDTNVLMRSAVITDIDGDGRNEILATANEGEEGAQTAGKGWLFLFRWENGRTEISKVIPMPGNTSTRALKVGDVVPGGTKEAVTACYRMEKGLRNAYIVGWAFDRGFIFEKFIDEVGEGQYGGLFIAVGDLSPEPGDEVLVARNNPNEIISLFWRGSGLVQGPKVGLEQQARINNVQIGAPRRRGVHSCILVSGAGEAGDQAGKFYMQLMSFGDGFIPDWTRIGGEKEDLSVSYAMFVEGKSPNPPIKRPISKSK